MLQVLSRIRDYLADREADRAVAALCARQTRERAFQRIYHFHIRKSAGTTINYAFLSNFCTSDVKDLYARAAASRNHRVVSNGKVVVCWNLRLFKAGYFNYGCSHEPYHKVQLPADTFTFTCLRDPVKRVLSHYNMLCFYRKTGVNHPCMQVEGPWLGSSFAEFLTNIPREHLHRQLYMFSKDFNVREAAGNIRNLSYYLFTENLDQGLKYLGRTLSLKLPISIQKKYDHREVIDAESMKRLRDTMQPEYELLEAMRSGIAA